MTIKELAREDVVTVSPDASATAIAETMDTENVGSVVVVDGDRPTGIITDRDLAMRVVRENANAAELDASELVTDDLFTVSENEGIYEVLSEMAEFGVRRLPLLDEDGAITGIVTLDDFVVLLTSELGNVSDIVQAESPPY